MRSLRQGWRRRRLRLGRFDVTDPVVEEVFAQGNDHDCSLYNRFVTRVSVPIRGYDYRFSRMPCSARKSMFAAYERADCSALNPP